MAMSELANHGPPLGSTAAAVAFSLVGCATIGFLFVWVEEWWRSEQPEKNHSKRTVELVEIEFKDAQGVGHTLEREAGFFTTDARRGQTVKVRYFPGLPELNDLAFAEPQFGFIDIMGSLFAIPLLLSAMGALRYHRRDPGAVQLFREAGGPRYGD